MDASCRICQAGEGGADPSAEGRICPRCVAELFSAHASERACGNAAKSQQGALKEGHCEWAPSSQRGGPRSLRARIDDLRQLADQSSCSMPPPGPPGTFEAPPSLRAAIQCVDLFPPTSSSGDHGGEHSRSPLNREEPEVISASGIIRAAPSRAGFISPDRVLMALAIIGSLVLSYHLAKGRVEHFEGRISYAVEAISLRAISSAEKQMQARTDEKNAEGAKAVVPSGSSSALAMPKSPSGIASWSAAGKTNANVLTDRTVPTDTNSTSPSAPKPAATEAEPDEPKDAVADAPSPAPPRILDLQKAIANAVKSEKEKTDSGK